MTLSADNPYQYLKEETKTVTYHGSYVDKFEEYEDQFAPINTDRRARRQRKPKARHVPKKSSRQIVAEIAARYERSVARRIKRAGFPVLKTLEQFRWSWPSKINRALIQDLFRLRFIEQNQNVVFMANVGLGKTHLK